MTREEWKRWTPKRQRDTIAMHCGWKIAREPIGSGAAAGMLTRYFDPDGTECWDHNVPDYLNDLNAMDKAFKSLAPGDIDAFFHWLRIVRGGAADDVLHAASAAQRAEAFCLAMENKT